MNTKLLENLQKRMHDLNFTSKDIGDKKLDQLTDSDILKYLSLNNWCFKEYLNLYLRLSNQEINNLNNINEIINLFFFHKKNHNLKELFSILNIPRILEYPNLLDFLRYYFMLDTKEKVMYLNTLIHSTNNVLTLDLTRIAYTVLKTKNNNQRDFLITIYIYKKNMRIELFLKFHDLILNYPNSDLSYISDCIRDTRGQLLKYPNAYDLLINFVKTNDKNQLDLLYLLLTKKAVLDSKVLGMTLIAIMGKYNKANYPYIEILIRNKQKLPDKIYEILLENIIIYSDKFKQDAICKLINYPTILENAKLFNFALDYILKSNTSYKANSIIEITKDETLVSNPSLNNLLNAIVVAQKKEQVTTLTLANKNILNHENADLLISHILKEKRDGAQKYLCLLLESNLALRKDILVVVSKLLECSNEYQMKGMMAILETGKVFVHANYSELLEAFHVNSPKKVKAITALICKTDLILKDPDLNYIKLLISSPDYKVNVLTKVLLKEEILGYEEVKRLISIIIKSEKSMFKIVIDYVDKTIGITEKINEKEKQEKIKKIV